MLKRKGNEHGLAWLFLGIFAILAILVKMNASSIQSIDDQGFQWLANLDGTGVTAFFSGIATLASPAVTVLLMVVFGGFLYLKHYRLLGLFAITTFIGGDALALGVKYLVARLRPSNQLVADTGYSFPSGHVFGTVLLVTIVLSLGLQFIASRPLRVGLIVLGIVWILLVMISRVYLRDHYTSDVAGSWLLAEGCWYQAKAWFCRWEPQLLTKLNQRRTTNR